MRNSIQLSKGGSQFSIITTVDLAHTIKEEGQAKAEERPEEEVTTDSSTDSAKGCQDDEDDDDDDDDSSTNSQYESIAESKFPLTITPSPVSSTKRDELKSIGVTDRVPLIGKNRDNHNHNHNHNRKHSLRGLDNVIEETSAVKHVDTNSASEVGVSEINESLVEYVCCTSGDLGHFHTLSSTWIPTGMFPQICYVKFKDTVRMSKVTVECSGIRRMTLIIQQSGSSGEDKVNHHVARVYYGESFSHIV